MKPTYLEAPLPTDEALRSSRAIVARHFEQHLKARVLSVLVPAHTDVLQACEELL